MTKEDAAALREKIESVADEIHRVDRTGMERQPGSALLRATDPPEEIQIQRWPVLERATDKDGHLLRKAEGYKRTKEPLETRDVRVLDLHKSAVLIAFTTVSSYRFSVGTGRCIGIPDWVLEKDSRAALKKVLTARKRAATKARKAEKKAMAALEADDGEDAVQRAMAEGA